MVQSRSLIDENGKRSDGRIIDELREVKINVGVIRNADGSALIEFGKIRLLQLCMVLGKFIQNTWHYLIDVL